MGLELPLKRRNSFAMRIQIFVLPSQYLLSLHDGPTAGV